MSTVGHSGVGHSALTGGTDRFRTLYQLLAALSRATALEDVFEAALTSLLEATAADRAAILLCDDDGVIRFKASRGLSREYQDAVAEHSAWMRGTREAQPLVIPDVFEVESLAAFRDAFRKEKIRAVAFVPLALDAGVFGKFMLYYDEPHECGTEELEIAVAIAAHVALATEHQRAELGRAGSEQRMQAILDNSPAVVFLKDLQGRYLLVNRRYEELFHVTRTSMLGRTDFDIFPAEMAERFRANDGLVLAAGKPLTFEEEAPHDDGVHSYISIKFPMEGPDGRVTGVCGIATDITERQRFEAASLHLAAIVESSDDAIISKDLNGNITSWNRGAERIFGYTAAEALGRPVSILTAPTLPNEMPDILAKIKRGERVEQYETRRRRKDGQVIDVALTVSPVRNAAGRIVGAAKIARDITQRKRAERERVLLLAREQEARRVAELLNRVAPRLAAQLDIQKLAQEVTDMARALVGAECGAFLQNAISEKDGSCKICALSGAPAEAFAGPGSADLFESTFRVESTLRVEPTLRGRSVVRSDDVTEDLHYAKHAPHFGTSVRSYLAAPVVARSGEVLGGLFFGHGEPGKFTATHEAILTGIAAQAAIAMDNARLFEQAQWVQAEIKRSNQELRRANEDLEVFAYSASHDLQEPLRTIAISAQLLERSWAQRLEGEDAMFMGNILTASHRMSVLIEDLLAYMRATKYEAGPPPTIDSAAVLTDVLASLQGLIEERHAAVTSADLPAVVIHENRLAQVFQNLISNAIKYSDSDKEVPRVQITAAEQDGWCVFSVADNGIGIDAQYAEQIFGLFKRLHGRDQYPGSGIGLALCQRVVEQYGGRIWLERSAPGEGSTFCFAVPSRAQ